MTTILETPPPTTIQNNQITNHSTKPEHFPALPEYSGELARKIGLTPSYVELVASAALGNNIRSSKKQDEVKTVIALSAELEYCAVAYCGASKTDDMVYDEVVMFVLARFAHLSITEIREAFRLAAAGEFEVDLTTYYGLFTVKLLGDILTKYNTYRNRIVGELTRDQNQREADIKHELKKQEFDWDQWADQRLSKLKENDNPHYRFCTAFDFEYFTKSGQLQFTEEQKKQAWIDSHQFAYSELHAGALTSFSLRRQIERVNLGLPDDGYKAKRIVIAQQLLVFRWLFPGLPETGLLEPDNQ